MTKRTELAHRVAETKARLTTEVANRVLTRKTTGLDGVVKRLVKRPARKTERSNS